ncbi:hypothetical protein B0H14DRAFT_2213495, partial [Mycena olivaceomarginata]
WLLRAVVYMPHRCTEDDIYRGMFIPAGTTIFPNIRDARYASSETHILTGIGNMLNRGMTLAYLPKPVGNAEPYFGGKIGFERTAINNRICIGQYPGDSSVWIAVATILASCVITNVVDKNGNIIIPPSEM